MAPSNYHKMIDRARKAGLNTRDIYRALTTCQPSVSEHTQEQTDTNGFSTHIDSAGRSAFSPPPARN